MQTTNHLPRIVLGLALVTLLACSGRDEEQVESTPAASAPKPAAEEETVSFTDAEVEEYINLFPYQDTFNYAMRYTGGDPAQLNKWVLGAKPRLVKAGQDRVVRMNNDTFYKMAFIDLRDGPVILAAQVKDQSRFVSFQLMDDRNVNYRNVIHPDGEYTLYRGTVPETVRGEGIPVPSDLSVVIVRVEVRDPGDEEDLATAAAVFNTITVEGPTADSFFEVDLLSGFSEAVAAEANYRMDEAFRRIPFRLTVAGPEQEPGEHVPALNHAAGTKGGWGGPGTEHSSYETIFFGQDQQPLDATRGDYTVTTEAPPVDAFWSLTVYDTERGGFLHPNSRDRYHLNGSMSEPNDDGTYTFLFKQACVETDRNCLEVPAGRFDIAARYYLPSEAIRSGEWVLPPITLVEQ